jgi:hypothetical protein
MNNDKEIPIFSWNTDKKEFYVLGHKFDGINSIKDFINFISNIQKKYDKALELLSIYDLPCEIDNFMYENDGYCSLECCNDKEQFKKCWNKYIEWKLENDK